MRPTVPHARALDALAARMTAPLESSGAYGFVVVSNGDEDVARGNTNGPDDAGNLLARAAIELECVSELLHHLRGRLS